MSVAFPPSVTLSSLAEASARAIIASQQQSGAFPASPSFSAYRGYCWFRDGSFIADAASAWGAIEEASRFFDWCARILEARAPQIDRIVAAAAAGDPLGNEDMLPTRFTFDGGEGDDDWWDFQLDGYGTWLWALTAHCKRHNISPQRWQRAIDLTVDYLASSWERPCYDWWEEHSEQVHGSTLGSIIAGLDSLCDARYLDPARHEAARSAAEAARRTLYSDGIANGHLVKWLGNDAVDASLASLIAPFGVVRPSDPIAAGTVAALDGALNVGGGVHRFLADTFYGGGQWPLLSCFLGLAYASVGDRETAAQLLVWAAGTSDEDQHLPEQVADHLLAPERQDEWIERWGTSASPLLWSHAMYLRLALVLGVVTPERTLP